MPWLLAAIPILCFALEYLFSARAGMLGPMLAHPTIMYADWLLVPFNWLVPRLIDWHRGLALFTISTVSAALVILTHALWQAQSLGPYNMITPAGMVMPAGWVHLAYTTVETTLLLAFVLCRRPGQPARLATAIAATYLVLLGLADYVVHGRVVAATAGIVTVGLLVLLWPRRT